MKQAQHPTGIPPKYLKQNLPAEHAKNEIENEKRPNDNEADEVEPRPAITHRIINLKKNSKEPDQPFIWRY